MALSWRDLPSIKLAAPGAFLKRLPHSAQTTTAKAPVRYARSRCLSPLSSTRKPSHFLPRPTPRPACNTPIWTCRPHGARIIRHRHVLELLALKLPSRKLLHGLRQEDGLCRAPKRGLLRFGSKCPCKGAEAGDRPSRMGGGPFGGGLSKAVKKTTESRRKSVLGA